MRLKNNVFANLYVYVVVLGGGLFGEWTNVHLKGVHVSSSSATIAGGCVSFSHSSASLQDTDISSCCAPIGGGVYLSDRSNIKMVNTQVYSNNATNGSGVYLISSSLTGTEVYIQANFANRFGGGIFVTGDSSTLNGLIVQNCTAPDGAGIVAFLAQTSAFTNTTAECNIAANSGGGLVSLGSSITMISVSITSNVATSGGGLLVSNSTVTGSLLILNNTAKRGGGVSIKGSAQLQGFSAIANSADDVGGGLCVESGVVTLIDVIFDSCFSMQGVGGAIFMQNATVTHAGVDISSCSASSGGGIYAFSANFTPQTQLSLSTLTGNMANNIGGAIYTTGTASTMSNTVVSNGTATNGGGIAIQSCLACRVFDFKIGSSYASQFGGGVYIGLGSSCLFQDSIVENSMAAVSGGGVAVQDSTFAHSNMSIRNNTAATGGGLFLTSTNAGLVSASGWTDSAASRTLIERNGISPAAQHGGNILIVCDGTCKLSSVDISGSAMVANGGGIYIAGQGQVDLRKMLLKFNAASVNGGGVMVTGSIAITLQYVGFYGNLANNGGGLLMQGDSTRNIMPNAIIDDCVFYNNTANQGGGGITFTYASAQVNHMLSIENRGITASGGGINAVSSSSMMISNSLFINNQATSGGSIMAASASNGSIQDVIVTGNPSSYSAPWDALFTDMMGFSYLAGKANRENPVTVQFGHLLYLTDKSTVLLLARSSFTYGSAESGGAIYMTSNAMMNADTCTFSNNQASESGGSFLVALNSQLSLTSSTISYSGLYSLLFIWN